MNQDQDQDYHNNMMNRIPNIPEIGQIDGLREQLVLDNMEEEAHRMCEEVNAGYRGLVNEQPMVRNEYLDGEKLNIKEYLYDSHPEVSRNRIDDYVDDFNWYVFPAQQGGRRKSRRRSNQRRRRTRHSRR